MNYATAKAIANQYAPKLLVDDFNPQMPNLLVVRKVAKGHPHSITLISLDPSRYSDIPARDAVAAVPAIPASADHPGTPEIPAQPAVAGRTAAGQLAEAEQKLLTDALDAAQQMIP